MNANATIPMNAQNPIRRGFKVRCPLCGTADDVQTLDLDDLSTFRCCGCDEQYTVDDVRELLASWQRVLTWIEAAPARDE